ncbi:MAG: hypothetical protein NTU95_09555 [Methanothrix sp.]|nr:hypothetical protein [Methanothrix sp.]
MKKKIIISLLIISVYLIGLIDLINAEDGISEFIVDDLLIEDPDVTQTGNNQLCTAILEHDMQKVDKRDSLQLRIYDTYEGDDNDFIKNIDYNLTDESGRKELTFNLTDSDIAPFNGQTYINVVDLTKKKKTTRFSGKYIEVFYNLLVDEKSRIATICNLISENKLEIYLKGEYLDKKKEKIYERITNNKVYLPIQNPAKIGWKLDKKIWKKEGKTLVGIIANV